jgi:hypothetical protein
VKRALVGAVLLAAILSVAAGPEEERTLVLTDQQAEQCRNGHGCALITRDALEQLLKRCGAPA